MAFPYRVTQMYIHNTHAHTRSEMRGHYKQLFISLPFKSICLRSAAKGTKSNCFPFEYIRRRVRLGSDNDFPRCSPLSSPRPLFTLLLPLRPPTQTPTTPPTRPSHLSARLHLCVRWGFFLTCTRLIEAGRPPSFSRSLLSLFRSQTQNS